VPGKTPTDEGQCDHPGWNTYLDAGSLVAPLDLPAVDSGTSLSALVPGMGAGSAVLKEAAWLKG
jgi:hypothetical protein